MEFLYAPWRKAYLNRDKNLCPFCEQIANPSKDEEFGVLFRAKFCYGVMNLYPYSPGHFMVLPLKHCEFLEDLNEETWQEMSFYVKKGVQILRQSLHAKGVNIGMNLGEVAGAGIAMHCHYHLVPRFGYDTNFITTIAQTRVCSVDLKEIYKKLKKEFNAI